MTVIIYVDTITTGSSYAIGTEDFYVSAGVIVGSTTQNAFDGSTGNDHKFTIMGDVFGELSGIDVDGDAAVDAGQRIFLGENGSVIGNLVGVSISSYFSHIVNYGTISGVFGVFMKGISIVYGSTLFNAGTIEGSSVGVNRDNSTENFTLINTGQIHGGNYAYSSSGTNVDVIRNQGRMEGYVILGIGDDTYDGRGGTVSDTVYAGVGKDTFFAGAGAETFDGGAGTDVLNFASTSGVRMSLANDVANTGTAAGDIYISIENVIGSRLGADRIMGNSVANNLKGQGGADILWGMAGNDSLTGGVGVDTLYGGTGNDVFVFNKLIDVGDVIKDFNNAEKFNITASGFGGGLVAGTLAASKFIARADHVAQDGNDRFIFDTTHRSVWFDVDGTGSAAAVMVADLQAGATITAANFLLI